MLKNIEKIELSIMKIKKSKLQRDLEDYNKNVVCKWHTLRRRNRTPRSILKHSRNDSSSSLDSSQKLRVNFDSSECETTDSHNCDEDILLRHNTRSSANYSTRNAAVSTPSASESFLGEDGAGGSTKGHDAKKKYGNRNRNT